ncbi:MAG: DUF1905 domain-containing protein [Candidatus Eremiobacteraeota bacterium]|nr:DUF1905 domain-containing protein [Candidatus Eremiobacteraeota bacterium]MBV9056028.1 DUF1905 domain-containing protein [Candidatus Eremiobacteraeota bacterium]
MSDRIEFKTRIEKAEDSAACGIAIATKSVLAWFGRKSRVPVRATINGFTYRSSLAPMGGRHMLPVNAETRKAANVQAGDNVTLVLEEDREERTVDVPDDLALALKSAKLRAVFDAMSYTHRKEWVRAILDAKRPETREKRIASCAAALRGDRSI